MRKILLVFCFVFSLAAFAGEDDFVKVDFGTPRAQAEQQITALFGEPNDSTDNSLIYYETKVNGCLFAKVVFGFQSSRKGSYLAQARFFVSARSKRDATRESERLVSMLEDTYPVTTDYEEDGTKFFTGGTAPAGVGRLFIIDPRKMEGRWYAELRFGPFRYLK